jgi:hypothetical protein
MSVSQFLCCIAVMLIVDRNAAVVEFLADDCIDNT